MNGELRTAYQRFPDRATDQREAGRLQMGDVAWLAGDQFDIGHVLLRGGARTAKDLWGVVHLVADIQLGHVLPLLVHDAGNVVTDDGGQRHVVDVVATSDLIVEGIDGGGVNAHPDLPRADSRYGNIAQLKSVEATELAEDDRFHGANHALTFSQVRLWVV
ncbi:hypothetical protein OKW87_12965 [Sphingomonas sp. M1-B02]|nr:hypothetical protein [Sphingomonas sp. S6-11]UZK65412.1 hypothetical protein OKW87_12965 [Sphingomonas sp. S6-11]